MAIFRKYEFGSKSAATAKINALGVDEEGSPTHAHSIVRLGHIITTPGEYDEDWNEITAPVFSDKYHVDVLWRGEYDDDGNQIAVADWDNQMVWCRPMGAHTLDRLAPIESILQSVRSCTQSGSPRTSRRMIGLSISVASGHVQDASTEYNIVLAFAARVLADGGSIENQGLLERDIRFINDAT